VKVIERDAFLSLLTGLIVPVAFLPVITAASMARQYCLYFG
jgi:hypothetical protein